MAVETAPSTTTGTRRMKIHVTVNGQAHDVEVETRILLVHFLRENLGMTGTHIGCDTTNCGACTANTVHDFTGRPFSSTVHAPQFVVSQPICVPVIPRFSRRKWTSSVRVSTSTSWA